MNDHKEKLRKQFHLPSQQKIKYLGINPPSEAKHLYSENCKTLIKEIRNDTNRQRDILCSYFGRINIVKMIYYPKQSTYSMESLSNYLWHSSQTWGKTLHLYRQTKYPNSQSNLEKGRWSWKNQAPQLQKLWKPE